MSLPIEWQTDAANDLVEIAGYIAQLNPTAADELVFLIEMAAERLSMHPYMAPAGRVQGTRELVVHANYILVYEVTAEVLKILAVVHSRMRYP